MTLEILNEPFIVDFEDSDENRPVKRKRREMTKREVLEARALTREAERYTAKACAAVDRGPPKGDGQNAS
jgi:hypothetical protein